MSMAIFHSKLLVYQRVDGFNPGHESTSRCLTLLRRVDASKIQSASNADGDFLMLEFSAAYFLVGGLEHQFHVSIMPTDFHIFQRDSYTTSQFSSDVPIKDSDNLINPWGLGRPFLAGAIGVHLPAPGAQ